MVNNPVKSQVIRLLIGIGGMAFGIIGFMVDKNILWLFLAIISFYISFGLEIQWKSKARKSLTEYLSTRNEQILYMDTAFLSDGPSGTLAVTERHLFYITRNGGIYMTIPIQDIFNYGSDFIGSGEFKVIVEDRGFYDKVSAFEEKIPVFYVEGRNYEEGEYAQLFLSQSAHKFFKHLNKNVNRGTFAQEARQQQESAARAEEMLAMENEVILENMNLIMDANLNDLDKGNQYYLQNLQTYQDALFDNLSEQILKLNSLTEEEDADLKRYLQACALRGHRLAMVALKARNETINETGNEIIPGEIVYRMIEQTNVPDYPALKKLVYTQYKYFRNQDQQLISEEEALRMTEEYIRIGFKNSMANQLALQELQFAN